MSDSQSTGPVTVDDVVRALGDLDPSSTNASKIREVLGRGSFATIQKHLDRLRAARTAQEPAQGSEVPYPPADVLATLWSAAYRAAGHVTAARLTEALTERDELHDANAVARADVAALAAQVDALESTAAAAVTAQALAETVATQAVEVLASERSAAAVQIAELGRAAETDLVEAKSVLELERRDHKIASQTQQASIDRLMDQIGELKSLLALQARPAN